MDTPASLIARLRNEHDHDAWNVFVDLYAPMLLRWCRRRGLSDQDAADCIQDILTLLVGRMREFEYDPNRSFRGWLKTVATNRLHDFFTRRQRIIDAEALASSSLETDNEVDVFDEQEYRDYVIGRALQMIETDFDDKTCDIFRELMLHHQSAEEVAEQFGVSRNAVYLAKSRVLRRLRERLDRLIDWPTER
ncbi:MAG: sigma-70 family RNA polymerase sigma factor [Planctomycetaceae bacterium]|nr:sigma-70 family RNA polymerase sigma factor [Planctomycetaceae bacterium]MCB9941968.1 sigma-70 family RNA polymerase sigma factor [Planctomycetaceae bacterium]